MIEKFKIINWLLGALLFITITTSGITIKKWQFWVILILIGLLEITFALSVR